MQHLGLLAVGLTVFLGIFLMTRWPMQKGRSFSENIASSRSSRLVFSIGMTLITALYYWFLLAWLGPHLEAPILYYGLVLLALIMQLVLAWVPATSGVSMRVHNIAAYGVGLIMGAIGTVLLFTGPQFWLSGLLVLFLAYTVLVYVLVWFVPKSKAYFLYYQLTFFALFWVCIASLTYAS